MPLFSLDGGWRRAEPVFEELHACMQFSVRPMSGTGQAGGCISCPCCRPSRTCNADEALTGNLSELDLNNLQRLQSLRKQKAGAKGQRGSLVRAGAAGAFSHWGC